MLLISAGPMELEYTQAYRVAALNSTELWPPEGTTHTAALRIHPAEYRQRVLGFLDRPLGGVG